MTSQRTSAWQASERTEFFKSCNLVGAGNGWNLFYLDREPGGICCVFVARPGSCFLAEKIKMFTDLSRSVMEKTLPSVLSKTSGTVVYTDIQIYLYLCFLFLTLNSVSEVHYSVPSDELCIPAANTNTSVCDGFLSKTWHSTIPNTH